MNILCATDLLPKSESAIDRAGMLADHLDADLCLLHVVTAPESAGMLEEDLRHASLRLKRRSRSPLWRYRTRPNVHVRAGRPARTIVDVLRELEPELLVLGKPRRGWTRDHVASIVATQVLSARICPVLLVGRMSWHSYRRIVLALDNSSAAPEIVRVAESLVIHQGAEASIVHAYALPDEGTVTSAGTVPSPASGDCASCSRKAADSLRALLSSASRDISRYAIEVEGSPAAEAIRHVVHHRNPDLLILGTRGHGRFRRALLGSVAHGALARIRCDVLVVPERKESMQRLRPMKQFPDEWSPIAPT